MKRFAILFTAIALLIPLSASARKSKVDLKVGDAAPAFSLPAHDGKTYTLESFKGRRLVVYFYPKDETPGCTKEACAFRDRNKDIMAKGAAVVGINGDSIASHVKFAKNHDLGFPLLSDLDSKVMRAYGVKGMLGMAKRTTFIIGSDGKIAHIFEDVKVEGHADEVIKALDSTK